MSDEANIPVLTEIISTPAAAPAAAEQDTASAAEKTPAAATTQLTEEQWQQLELQIRENVLKQLLTRIDFVLEHRVRDSLADVLQTAVAAMANDVRAGLKNSLEEVITRAVTQEISKTRSGLQ